MTPLLAHVAGIPVEEVLPGVVACGAAGIRVATVYVRRRLGERGERGERGARRERSPRELAR